MKAEDEWSALTSKVAGLEQGYKRTACILALCPLSELADSSISLNPFCKVVLENGEAHSVIGSLDLNQGCQLPGELSGDYPESTKEATSQMCVWHPKYASEVWVQPFCTGHKKLHNLGV